jgi:hypothetical protein
VGGGVRQDKRRYKAKTTQFDIIEGALKMNKENALKLVKQHVKTKNLVKHMLDDRVSAGETPNTNRMSIAVKTVLVILPLDMASTPFLFLCIDYQSPKDFGYWHSRGHFECRYTVKTTVKTSVIPPSSP